MWSPSHNPNILKCILSPQDQRDKSSGVLLSDLSCEQTLVQCGDGETHLLLSGKTSSLQLVFNQNVDLEKNIHFEVRLGGPGILTQQIEAAACLNSLLRRGIFSRSYRKMPARFHMTPELLFALDLANLGYSQREIAQRIFGKDAIMTGWNGLSHHIKSRTYRLIKKGRKLIDTSHQVFFDPSDRH